jgi:hypothetical protein
MELSASMRDLALIRLRKSHPNEPIALLRRRLAGEIYGEALMNAICGPLREFQASHHA